MIQDTLSKVVYVANGEQREWDVPFQFYDSKDLHIYLTDDGVRVEEVFQNFEYNEESKHIIYPTPESGLAPLEAGKQILILRETPNTQEEDSSEIYFKSKDIERGLDKLTMQVQELARDSYRAVKVSHFDTTSPEDFTEMLFEAGAKAEEAAARAATSESNAALSEQNATSSKLSAEQASATAVAASQLATSKAEESLRNAERAEIAAADSDMHSSHAAESASMAAALLQEVSNSIYNKAQVDAKISGLQAEIDTVESYIPSGTSDSNMLVNKKELLDEEMDIREDLNQGLSELQNQITAQSSTIAGKQDKLIAGPNITINGNVISATGSGESGSSDAQWGAITGDINAQTDLINLVGNKESEIRADVNEADSQLQAQITAQATAIAEKQDKLIAGEGVTIEGNVISATGGGGGGSAELPDNVYTEENLVAGEGIEIRDESNSGGIDEDTLLCLHFDNNVNDSSTYADSLNSSNLMLEYSQTTKFGDASCYSISGTITNNVFTSVSDALTIDFWVNKNINENTAGTQISWGTNGGFGFAAYGSGSQSQFYVSINNDYIYWPFDYDSSLLNNSWNHLAGVFSKNEEGCIVARLFVNGHKVLEETTPNTMFSPVGEDMSQINFIVGGGIDEFRISKKAVWTEDFTPSAEPYAVADSGSKKSINAIIPEGIYTKTNLLGGKDIEIIPEPVEGGIDEYTLSCFHLDENTEDIVTGYVPPNVEIDTTLHKFGTGSTMWTNTTSFPWSLNSYESFSFDFWIYRKSDRTAALGLGIVGGSPSCHVRIFAGGYPIQFSIHGLSKDTGVYIDNNTWSHIYVYYNANDRSYHLFLNGKEIYSEVNTTAFSNLNNFASDGYTTSRFDEIRISKCIRWTEDFTPPTQPYRKAEPTGNYVINFTGEAGGSGKNIGEVYYSQSSLASDNAGALPLFTGETIASANTIYPEFYAWVESHTELQTTAEEYETALTTYGECPKYVISNGSLRLPKLANYIKMANNADGITQSEAGLPNIKGYFDTGAEYYNANQDETPPFSATSVAKRRNTDGEDANQRRITFDASTANPIYGNSDTVTPAHTTLYPWVFAYNATVTASTAQAAEFQNALSGKADSNLGNIPSNYDYVIERYDDGAGNWYEVWKSGRLRQGGISNGASITLLLPFIDTNYTLVTTLQRSSNTSSGYGYIYNKTATSFQVVTGDGFSKYEWQAEGKGAEL